MKKGHTFYFLDLPFQWNKEGWEHTVTLPKEGKLPKARAVVLITVHTSGKGKTYFMCSITTYHGSKYRVRGGHTYVYGYGPTQEKALKRALEVQHSVAGATAGAWHNLIWVRQGAGISTKNRFCS